MLFLISWTSKAHQATFDTTQKLQKSRDFPGIFFIQTEDAFLRQLLLDFTHQAVCIDPPGII